MIESENQSWFWTLEWQAKEAEADSDLEEGRYLIFDNADDFLDSLKGKAHEATNILP
jgi:hypothetical protein